MSKIKLPEFLNKKKQVADEPNEILPLTTDSDTDADAPFDTGVADIGSPSNSVMVDNDTQKLIDDNPIEGQEFDTMPSANIRERDGGNSKKAKLAIGAVLGTALVIGGIGVSMGRAEKAKEEQRAVEAQEAANEQKKMATGTTLNLEAEQQDIKANELPPPNGVNDPLAGSQAVTPPPFADSSASQAYQSAVYPDPAPLPDPVIADPAPVATYEPPKSKYADRPVERDPMPTFSSSGFMSPSKSSDDKDKTETVAPPPVIIEKEPVVIPPPKGSDSEVLLDVATGKASVLAQNTSNSAGASQGQQRPQGNTRLQNSLTPTSLANGTVSRGNTSMLLTKGTNIPCVLTSKIDSTYQGFTSCQVSRDVYSANGKVLLIERGSKVFGEQNVQINQGQARVSVLWTRIDTPKGVSINVDSPATGQMGEMGIGAKVNNHYGKRFGNALLLSVIQDGLEVAIRNLEKRPVNNTDNSTTVTNTTATVQDMANKVLDNSINIAPTAIVKQGTVVNIRVARDVDFSSLYSVKKR